MTSLAHDGFRQRDRLWPAVVASVVAHLAFGGLAFVYRPPPALDPSQRPIVAKLVRLGEPRPPELLPRKEAPPPPAAEAPAPAAPAAPAPPAAPVPTTRPTAPRAPAPRPAAKPAAPSAARPAPGRLASVLSELSQELQAGSPDGDPLGDAGEPGEGDAYLAAVVSALRQNYRLPTTISERDRLHLTGSVVLFIEPGGAVTRHELTKRSGNAAFDEALERAVRQTRLPPPPADRRELYRRTGLQVDFRI